MNDLLKIVLFIGLPAFVMILGGGVATFRQPGPKMGSALQHFAAGTVFAAVAMELLPEIQLKHNPLATVIGFASGVMLMLGVKWLNGRNEQAGISFFSAIGIDLTIDGFLLGIAFVEGSHQSFLLTLALTLELLGLGLAAVPMFRRVGIPRGRGILTLLALALLLLTGAVVGMTILANAPAFLFDAILAFGVAALLYLVTEELLVEAHEVPETPLTTSIFFAGFLLLLIVDMLTAQS